jgi:hypothetical protein
MLNAGASRQLKCPTTPCPSTSGGATPDDHSQRAARRGTPARDSSRHCFSRLTDSVYSGWGHTAQPKPARGGGARVGAAPPRPGVVLPAASTPAKHIAGPAVFVFVAATRVRSPPAPLFSQHRPAARELPRQEARPAANGNAGRRQPLCRGPGEEMRFIQALWLFSCRQYI